MWLILFSEIPHIHKLKKIEIPPVTQHGASGNLYAGKNLNAIQSIVV
jgi:hypothetical protein